MNDTILFVLSAPSGAGKTTILKKVMANLPGLVFSISHTTRPPRPGEVDGRDYHFVSREEFKAIREATPPGFFEWAKVHGNFYGTGRAEVERQLRAGQDVILDIELLEMEIDHFFVLERDRMIIGCAALYPFAEEQVGELACVAVHVNYRKEGRGDDLLEYAEKRARQLGSRRLFVLTTRTGHWFLERGFREGELTDLPVKKQAMYNYQRRSKVFIKPL